LWGEVVRKSFVSGAVILTVAGLAARMLGFVYRVYLSNLVGAEGMGLYELVIPVYTAVVLTITSGISIAVSKIVAEQNARSDMANPGRVTVCAIVLAAGAGLLVSAVISLNAGAFASKVLGDERTLGALLILVPCLPGVVAASALKGYFYGMQQVVPTAISQIAEQAVKFLILLLAAGAIMQRGTGYACTAAVFAAAAGEILNMLILLGFFQARGSRAGGRFSRSGGRFFSSAAGAGERDQPGVRGRFSGSAARAGERGQPGVRGRFSSSADRAGKSEQPGVSGRFFSSADRADKSEQLRTGKRPHTEKRFFSSGVGRRLQAAEINGRTVLSKSGETSPKTSSGRKPLSRMAIVKALLRVAVPISANRMIISSLAAAEYILIPVMLAYGGMDEKSSMEIFGRLTGMALPLVMFPSIVTNSIATTLVPALSESAALKRYRALNRQISKSIQVTFILGIIFTSLFICFSEEIGSLVYRQEKIGDLLFMLSFSCIFIYLQQTLTGVLNGLGKQGILLRNTVTGSILRIAVICILMPVFGIRAYIIGMTVSLVLTECLDLIEINKMTGLVIDLREWLVKPGLAGVLMIAAGRYIYHFFEMLHFDAAVTILLAVAANVMFAGILMMIAGVLDVRELMSISGLGVKTKNCKN
jgi:O-antigen/teichoic acid export membrane protein